MDANEYRKVIAHLGLSQVKSGAALGTDPRTARRWAKDGPPSSVAVALTAFVVMQDNGMERPWDHPAIVEARKKPPGASQGASEAEKA
jgi:hypothetical protein